MVVLHCSNLSELKPRREAITFLSWYKSYYRLIKKTFSCVWSLTNYHFSLHLQDLPFPAITICNLNKFRKSTLSKTLPNVQKVLHNYRVNKFQQGKSKSDWQSSDEQKKFFLEKTWSRSGISVSNNVDAASMDSVSSTDILETMTLQASASYSVKDLKKAGHQFEDLIVSCRWMGIQCHTG